MNLEFLKNCGTVKQYSTGDFICKEAEPGKTAFLLLQGEVGIIMGSFIDRQKMVASLQPGVIFGEMSLLENKPRNASVVASQDNTLVLEIEKSNFLIIMKADPDIAYKLLRTLLERTDRTMGEIGPAYEDFVLKVKTDTIYQQLMKITEEQFQEIVSRDSEYALQLLKFLSHTLAEINTKM